MRGGDHRGSRFPWGDVPRRPRLLAPETTYHVTSRGNEKRNIARDDADWEVLTGYIDRVVRKRGWLVQTFCFMPNHLHLVLRTPEPDLSDGMREVLGDYARDFNDRHDRTGHLFQGRFYSGVIKDDPQHMEVMRYVALNPLRAGLAPAPELWRWSAHLALLGLAPAPAFLDTALEPFSGDVGDYAGFVRTAAGDYLGDLVAHPAPERIRLALAAGFSQRQIGEALGVRQQQVGRRAAA